MYLFLLYEVCVLRASDRSLFEHEELKVFTFHSTNSVAVCALVKERITANSYFFLKLQYTKHYTYTVDLINVYCT